VHKVCTLLLASIANDPVGALLQVPTGLDATREQLEMSLAAMQQSWPDFEAKAEQQGWQLEKAIFPIGDTRLQRLD
jgi:hypothetical protein